MSSINGLGQPSPVQQTTNAKPAGVAGNAGPTRAADRVELSGVSHLMSALKTNDIRVDKVAQIKAQIEAGTYDADGKNLDGALDGVLDEIDNG